MNGARGLMVHLVSKPLAVMLVGLLAYGAAGCSRDKPSEQTAPGQGSLAAQALNPAEPIPTNRVEGEAFLIEWKAGSGAPGEPTKGQLVLTPKAPFKCNLEYPYKLKLTAAAVGLTKAELTKPDMNVDAKQVVIPVEYTAPTQLQTIDGHLAFSVCTDDKCLIERTQLKMTTQAL